jgi:hypothetical protein
MGGAITPGNNAGGVMAAMENSSHSHPGNVAEDFVRYPPIYLGIES